MGDARAFGAALERAKLRVEEDAVAALRQHTRAAVAAVVARSLPHVRRGRFIASWRVGINAPDLGTAPFLDPTGQVAVAAAEQVLASSPTSLAAWQRVHVSNAQPYGELLERRHAILSGAAADLAAGAGRQRR